MAGGRTLLFLTVTSIAFGQEPASARAFEVASIKPSKTFHPPNFPLDPGDAYAAVGGRFYADFPLIVYITFAYKLSLTRDQRDALTAALPKWAASDLFEIEARANGTPTKDQMRLMMQSLLAERFKLAVHFESRDMPLLALVLAKPGKLGPNLRPHEQGPACDSGADVFPRQCQVYARIRTAKGTVRDGSRNTTMEIFAGSLRELGRPVVDRTGLHGKIRFRDGMDAGTDWPSAPRCGSVGRLAWPHAD